MGGADASNGSTQVRKGVVLYLAKDRTVAEQVEEITAAMSGYRHAAKTIDGDYMVGNGAGVRFDRSAIGKPVRPDYLTVDQQESAFKAFLQSERALTAPGQSL